MSLFGRIRKGLRMDTDRTAQVNLTKVSGVPISGATPIAAKIDDALAISDVSTSTETGAVTSSDGHAAGLMFHNVLDRDPTTFLTYAAAGNLIDMTLTGAYLIHSLAIVADDNNVLNTWRAALTHPDGSITAIVFANGLINLATRLYVTAVRIELIGAVPARRLFDLRVRKVIEVNAAITLQDVSIENANLEVQLEDIPNTLGETPDCSTSSTRRIRSDKDTHFTGAIAYNAAEQENLTGLVASRLTIESVMIQAMEKLHYQLRFYSRDTFWSGDMDLDTLIGVVDLDLFAHGEQYGAANVHQMVVEDIELPYEDLDATTELHVALVNRSVTPKTAAAPGQVVVDVRYRPRG